MEITESGHSGTSFRNRFRRPPVQYALNSVVLQAAEISCCVNCDSQKFESFCQKLAFPFGQKPAGFLQCIEHRPDSSKVQFLWIPCGIRDWGEDADIVHIMDDKVVERLVWKVGALDGGKKALEHSGAKGITQGFDSNVRRIL